MTSLADVLRYAARGWQCFPIRPGTKLPACPRGFYDATTNPATLARFFARYDYNIGIRTGVASRIFILDVDGDSGFASLADLEFENGRLPPTLASNTGKGRHYWFTCADPLPCSAGKIGTGLDIRGDGGFAVAPPSTHANGKKYCWLDATVAPALAPDWLVRLAHQRKFVERGHLVPPPPRFGPPGAYGRAALDREIANLRAAAPGGRNAALNRSTFRLFQLVAGGELNRAEVEVALARACVDNGLVDDDGWPAIRKTMASGARAGLQHPRSRGAP
jgi:putative DNA primase/helicase